LSTVGGTLYVDGWTDGQTDGCFTMTTAHMALQTG